MTTIKCSRCGKSIKGKTEHDAEVKFSQHKCKGKRNISEMPLDILEKVAKGEITEGQAWEIVDQG